MNDLFQKTITKVRGITYRRALPTHWATCLLALPLVSLLACPPSVPCGSRDEPCVLDAPTLEDCDAENQVSLSELMGTNGEQWVSRFVSVTCAGDCIKDGAIVFNSSGYADGEDAALYLYGKMFGSSSCGENYIPVQRMTLDECGFMRADSDYRDFLFEGQFYWDDSLIDGIDYHVGVLDSKVNALQLVVTQNKDQLIVTLHRADPDGSGFYTDALTRALEGTVCE